jgi:hypothetical protein
MPTFENCQSLWMYIFNPDISLSNQWVTIPVNVVHYVLFFVLLSSIMSFTLYQWIQSARIFSYQFPWHLCACGSFPGHHVVYESAVDLNVKASTKLPFRFSSLLTVCW